MKIKGIFRVWAALILAVLLSSSGGTAAAQVIGAAGAGRGWSPAFAAATPAQVSALQGFLASPLGAQALALSPGLRAFGALDPQSPEHQAVLGAMPLPAAAAMTPATVAAAYAAAQAAVSDSLRTRAKDVLASVASGRMGMNELEGADRDLARVASGFSAYSPDLPAEYHQVASLASASRGARSMASARRLAREFLAAAPAAETPGPSVLAGAGTKKPLVALQPSRPAAARTAELGVDLSAMDASVRPQADFFDYVNGTWIKNFKIPADKSSYGVFDTLYDQSQEQIRTIIEEAAAAPKGSADNRRIAALYKSFMDEAAADAKGAKPVAADLKRIDSVKTKKGLPGLFAWAEARGIGTPVNVSVGQDSKNPDVYIASLDQSGLGLPDRDYYFNDDERTAKIRAKYLEYITNLLTLAGETDAPAKAAQVYALEKALAEKQWTQVELRDAVKGYNKVPLGKLRKMSPGVDWSGFLRQAKVRSEEKEILVGQPSYLTGFAQVLKEQPIEAWKNYMKVRALSSSANYLSKPFVDASFAYRSALTGATEMRPRWKRGVQLVDGSLGEAIGRVYVQKHFPESSKARMLELVENLRAAYAQRISAVSWMSDATKAKALEKLKKFTPKIGYPDKWIDYSKLRVRPDDLTGNARRVAGFEYKRMMDRLGKPVDRGEWGMTPQDINAYYNPVMNEIVFPAGILQAPFFNPAADDAVNYGAIGGIIGHEMSHGFDDQGAEYDASGRLENWWTDADRAAFKTRTAMLVKQFNEFEPIPGQHVNGELTLGENIADLGGLTIALQAYKLSLGGKEAPVINGFTGEQRVFLGWAQAWRGIERDEALSQQMATDPHSPNKTRVNGVMRNMPEFYKAFGLKPGDELYLAPNDRVQIW